MSDTTSEKQIATVGDLEAYETVQTWFNGWREQWGEDISPADRSEKLRPLLTMARELEKTPDEMVKQCTLVKDGARRISVKGRRFYWERIKEVQDSGDRKAANSLRSFFIHNGIMMQAETQKTGTSISSPVKEG
jgi:hypothetical protein